MRLLFVLPLVLLVGVPGPAAAQRGTSDGRDWQEWRTLALDAAARGEYEAFHDLAWRVVQTGPARDPDLMFLLARAQCLSGRPHDALVMLRRIAELGVAVDVAEDDDFRRTRALDGWPEVAALIARVAADSTPTPAASIDRLSPDAAVGIVEPPLDTQPPGATALRSPAVRTPPLAVPSVATGGASEPAAVLAAPAASAAVGPRFARRAFVAGGLAYDAVSGRFLVADRSLRTVVAVDEASGRTVDLVRAASAGFYDIEALEIDGRGNLWVVSAAGDPGADSGSVEGTALHQLQLVSGRPLGELRLAPEQPPGWFADVAVARSGAVMVLDTLGRRVLRVDARARTLDAAATLSFEGLTSLAPGGTDRFVYVAHQEGLARLDLTTGAAVAITAPADLEISGLTRIRWHNGSLVGIQTAAGGGYRLVRVKLDQRGRTVTALDVLDAAIAASGGTAATVSGDTLYYLGSAADASPLDSGSAPAESVETVVRSLRLQ